MPDFQIPSIDWATIGAPLVLVVWATALLMIDLFISNKRVTSYLALLGLGVAAAVALPFWNTTPRTSFGGMVLLDNTAIAVDLILVLIAAVSILLAIDYLHRQEIEMGEFYPLLLFTTAAMMVMGHGRNLIMLFLALEWLSIGLYILTGFAYPRLRSQEAAMKYLLYGAFAAGFLIYGIAVIYGTTGASDLTVIAERLRANPALARSPALLIGVGLLLIGFGYKISMAPFHMWTPDVYEGAPTPVTAYMSAATKVAGFAALLRVLQLAFPLDLLPSWRGALAVLAAITMIVGNVSAVAQSNIKRMLAYSSIAHAGFILCAFVALDQPTALGGLLYYLLAYSLTNVGAFAVVIALEQAGEERFDIASLAGMGWRHPVLGLSMALFMLSLAGIPILPGFFAKFFVFFAAYEAGYWWLVLLGLLTSIVSAFYYLRIIVNMYMRDEKEAARSFVTSPLRLGVTFAMVLLLAQLFLLNPVLNVGQTLVVGR
jgi:NADH-quinone oxidoreductase subunit N